MTQNKTVITDKNVIEFINSIANETKRKDCLYLIELLKELTQLEPKMWGPSIIGFGNHHYKYESGREGESPNFAFSPRATSIALYLSGGFEDRELFLESFGKHKTDKGCVHIKSLADIDTTILLKMISNHLNI